MDKWNPAAMKAGHDLFMASQITTCSGFAEDGSPRDAAAKFHYTAPGVGYMADFFFFAFYTHKGRSPGWTLKTMSSGGTRSWWRLRMIAPA